ncbi:galectin-3b [Scyliorhinus canicula]|uniref:galectin-3b n=1 Tax=Scyliorhinus canicula TaxID=7830 RepID=UPI0018F2B65B|nr:galectin-3b [Scyliorhinus canicula]
MDDLTDDLSLADALDFGPSNADKVKADGNNPQPGWPSPQSGPWPGQPGRPGPGQPGPWPGQPGQPGPWPGQPGQPGPWPGQPGQPGPWPGQPGQPGPWQPGPGQPGPWPGQPGPGQPGPWPGQAQPGQPGPWPGQAGPWPGQPGPQAPFGSPSAPNQSGEGGAALPVPYELSLPGGWEPQKMIRIMGTAKTNVDKFTIDVHSGPDILFHFGVRFNDWGQQVMVRNSMINNSWGGEEREAPRFPFKPGQKFEILLLAEPTQYKMAVNNQHLLEFRHRYKTLKDITKVAIHGDISLQAMFMK